MSDPDTTRFRAGQRIRANKNITCSIMIKKEMKSISIPRDQLGIFVRYSDMPDECVVNFDYVGNIEANVFWITDKV